MTMKVTSFDFVDAILKKMLAMHTKLSELNSEVQHLNGLMITKNDLVEKIEHCFVEYF